MAIGTLTDAQKKQIEDFKLAYNQASASKDTTAMQAAHANAEAVRAQAGFSGGGDGSQTIALDQSLVKPPVGSGTDLPQYQSQVGNISGMYDSMLAAQKASLQQGMNQGISNYQGQIDGAAATYQPQRDAVDVATNQGLQRQNETAAAKGISFSGGVQSDAGATVASGQGQKTALTQQEISFVDNLKKAINDLKASTSSQEQQLIATNTAQKNQALIDENARAFTNQYNSANDQFNRGIATAGLTGTYNGQDTLQKQQTDTQSAQWLKTFNYAKDRDKIADGQWLNNFNQSASDSSESHAISWGNLQLNRDQYEWSKNPKNPDNIAKLAAADAKGAGAQAKLYEDTFKKAWDMIGVTIKSTDGDVNSPNYGKQTDTPRFKQDDVAKLIMNSGLDKPEQDRLANSLNLK